ncbi:aminoglycoside 6'-N-acetyltransferase [Bacillus oleivorans]|uniref:Aminoglycoside 6'-N-acetyltransferase n=1 Tax=Bacillus oleivorans TaxID=1448271 RepID=A0A285D524_9BACI|nr:GNAT family N-acetyltransferase [Bacillus oleivorans]SNX74914.1 aminoglycoside 6'-N-acetyltransferase [Bacillus oleivorans]
MILFQKENLLVRILKTEDNMFLAKWLSDPQVLQFYEGRDNPFTLEEINEKFYNREDEVMKCIVEYEEKEIGYIQFYPVEAEERLKYGYSDNQEVIYGTDQFIGETDFWNKGIGTRLVQAMIEYLVKEKRASKVVMDPQTWNERAIAVYEKCGMRKVKLLPKNEWHEGEYRDCWLMEYHPV